MSNQSGRRALNESCLSLNRNEVWRFKPSRAGAQMHQAIYWIAASPVIYGWMRGDRWAALLVFAAIPILMGLPPAMNWPLSHAENAASDVVLYAVIALLPMAVLWVRDGLIRSAMERDARRTLPPLGITLPGREKAISGQSCDRGASSRASPRQPVDQARRRVRTEPSFDKSIG